MLFDAAGSTHILNGNIINEYIVGDMTTTVYPVRGGVEDWAYAASFDYDGHQGVV